MKINRYFTKAGHEPLEGIPFVPRASRITKLDGSVVFEAKDVMVPEGWSQVAVDILAQKYFRRKGIDILEKVPHSPQKYFPRQVPPAARNELPAPEINSEAGGGSRTGQGWKSPIRLSE